jgi:3-deoxy-7-phosphoheptulonate synthase
VVNDSHEQILQQVQDLKFAGATAISVFLQSIQDLQVLERLREATRDAGMLLIVEIDSDENIETVSGHDVDMLEVTASHMHGWMSLKRLAQTGLPIVLRRGLLVSSTELERVAQSLKNRGAGEVTLLEPVKDLDFEPIRRLQERSNCSIIVELSGAIPTSLMHFVISLTSAIGAAGIRFSISDLLEPAVFDKPLPITLVQLAQLVGEINTPTYDSEPLLTGQMQAGMGYP